MTVYGANAGWSVGVEEEFLLADRATGRPVPAAERVLRAAADAPPAAADARLSAELLATQVEAATGPCTTLSQLRTQLVHGRRQLARAAADLLLVPSGTAVLDGGATLSNGGRFARMAERFAGVVRDYQACGTHVHVGVPDLATAVGVLNHLRPWLPVLLTLSVNSPVHHGTDTGYASWRMVEQSRFPGAGVPPRFATAADYTACVDQLVSVGVLVDGAMSFWLARPSPHLPTVEFRVADAMADVDGVLLQAALCRALVRTALADLARGRPAPELGDQLAAAALWSSARHGLSGAAVHPLLGLPVSARTLAWELVDTVAPALVAAGDLSFVEKRLRWLEEVGTGAEHQRAVGDPVAIVRMLAERAQLEGAT